VDGAYRFELRRADEIVATGHLRWEGPLAVGDWIEIGRRHGVVRAMEPVLGEPEQRLVVQLLRDS
jgi:hypothetical protein